MIHKGRLFSALFMASFPLFGFGSYYGLKNGLSKGLIMSTAPFVLIILLHLIDSVYRRDLRRALNPFFWLCLLYIGLLWASQFVALRNGIPGVQVGNVLLNNALMAAPFLAAVIVVVQNRRTPGFDFGKVLFIGLGALIAINVLGYAAGVRSYGFGFEGRTNFPFIRGIYTGAHLISVWALMLLVRMRGALARPVAAALAAAALLVCLYFMVRINSRLSFMVFLALFALFATRAIRVARGIYLISLFTLPLLLSFSMLVYRVLTLPVFAKVLERVDKEDVTSFNGRRYIWEAVGDWAWSDRRGLLLGNGYKGHYTLRLYDEVARLWGEPHSYNIHSHSTFAEALVSLGIVGVALLYLLFWKGFTHYRRHYLKGTSQAPLFAGMCYLLFIWQLDIFCYGTDLGHAILFAMLAPLCIRPGALPEGMAIREA
ncbi:MAG: O-antigen ligase family protein [Flavobacteriales bacterium]